MDHQVGRSRSQMEKVEIECAKLDLATGGLLGRGDDLLADRLKNRPVRTTMINATTAIRINAPRPTAMFERVSLDDSPQGLLMVFDRCITTRHRQPGFELLIGLLPFE